MRRWWRSLARHRRLKHLNHLIRRLALCLGDRAYRAAIRRRPLGQAQGLLQHLWRHPLCARHVDDVLPVPNWVMAGSVAQPTDKPQPEEQRNRKRDHKQPYHQYPFPPCRHGCNDTGRRGQWPSPQPSPGGRGREMRCRSVDPGHGTIAMARTARSARTSARRFMTSRVSTYGANDLPIAVSSIRRFASVRGPIPLRRISTRTDAPSRSLSSPYPALASEFARMRLTHFGKCGRPACGGRRRVEISSAILAMTNASGGCGTGGSAAGRSTALSSSFSGVNRLVCSGSTMDGRNCLICG